jgi:hypothetical protein
MRPTVPLRRALADPNLLGKALQGSSWAAWRTLLIAAAGEPLEDAEREVFTKLTGREREPLQMVSELVAIVGRRGGKSRAMSTMLCWIAGLCDHADVLAAGETGVALCVSRDQRVAKIILNYCTGILEESPILRQLIVNRTADTLELSNHVTIEVRPASFRTLRGPTFVAVVADEVAFWATSTDYANPDTEILNAVRPGLLTSGGPLVLASSAYAKVGELYDAFMRDYGPTGDPRILVARGTSRDLHPTLPHAEIDRALARDAVRNRAEYLSEFRDDVEGFISRDIVERCVGTHIELPPYRSVLYRCFVDPASGVPHGDSFAMAICHRQEGVIIVDVVRETRPPFSPEVVIDELARLCKRYRISRITGDNYAGEYPKELFRKRGITYELVKKHRSDIYRDFLPVLNSGGVILPQHDRLVSQICGLERSVARSGRDEITHPSRGHDDVANACAGAVSIAGQSSYSLWSGWLDDDEPKPSPLPGWKLAGFGSKEEAEAYKARYRAQHGPTSSFPWG